MNAEQTKNALTTPTLVLSRPVIAVTGSAGKTTTKEMIASILARRWTIFKSSGNFNYIKHTRRYARSIRPSHRAVVLEFGMLKRGDIRKHCRIIQPNIGVITNIGTAHIGHFNGKMDEVALAKSELIRNMKRTGVLILNADCPYSRQLTRPSYRGRFTGTHVTVGINRPATYRAFNIRYEKNGMSFQCRIGGRVYPFFIPVPGKHNITNALLAIAVARTLGFSPRLIQEGLRHFARPPRRLRRYRFPNGIQVIDDTFSANPHAVKAAVDVLCQVGTARKIAVLGSMLDMGKYSVTGHRDVGSYLGKKKVDYVFTYGESARHIARGAIRSGIPEKRVIHCRSKSQLHRLLAQRIKPNTTILVKGSHKMKMNETVTFLRQHLRRKQTNG